MEAYTEKNITINDIECFVEWKDTLTKISTSNGILYDVKKHYKYLTESELINYYFKNK